VGLSLFGLYLIVYSLFFLFLEYIQLYFMIQFLSPIYLFFIFITIYPIVNIKQKIKEWVRQYTFGQSTKLNKSLEEITELISNPISLRRTMRVVIKKITEALEIETLIIMVSSEKFPSLEFKQINLLKIIPNSEVWNYLKNEKDVTITSSLQFGSGLRLSVYKFLTNLKIQLAFPMYGFDEDNTIDAFFLVGEKRRATSFSLAEIRFIQECARLTDLIIHNYQLLLDDIQKKKMERNLKAASIIEETISAYKTFNEPIAGTEVNFFTIPAVEISGDYLDLIKLNEKEVAIFLGDVSGHGLGSGYLVNAMKAMIRNQIQIGLSLAEILENINHFLIERYGGSEFMTLIAGKYDSSLGSFEFINAGHMAPMILKENGKLEFAKGSNRILGVLKSKYNLHTVILEKGDRLILYSDGITETFSVSDEIYGDTRFRDFIIKTNGLNGKEVISKLKLELDNFRSSKSPLDDTSLIYLKRL
jgi:serine phosphatase RsbU (regulator of sigma subunit)